MTVKLSPVGSQFQVNQASFQSIGIAFNQQVPDVVPLTDGRFVVAYESWVDNPGADIDVYAQIVNANGTLAGGPVLVAAHGGKQVDPAVAARLDGGFATVWQDFGTTTGAPIADPDIYYAVTNSAGTNTVNRTLLMDSAQSL